jgi:hypothetical protein
VKDLNGAADQDGGFSASAVHGIHGDAWHAPRYEWRSTGVDRSDV